ncbi:MAG: hypothetical protein Q9227_009124 [Pyrenula ochraceoflavens]
MSGTGGGRRRGGVRGVDHSHSGRSSVPGGRGQTDGPGARGGGVPSVSSASGAGSASGRGRGVANRSRAGSPGAPPSSLSGVPPSSASGPVSSHGPLLVDPARDPDRIERLTDSVRNVDLPASGYNINQEYGVATEFARRPGFNTTGKEIVVAANSFAVDKWPTNKIIYQYDINIGNGKESRALISKVWDSKAVKTAIGTGFLFDGNKLAWSLKDLGSQELRILVDLDQEQNKRPGRNANQHRVTVRRTKQLDLEVLRAYINGQISFNNAVLESINFMDHLLRENPSTNKKFIAVRRQFYTRDTPKKVFPGGVEVMKGVYQSLRIAQGGKLVVNLDVANCCFWHPISLVSSMIHRNGLRDPPHLISVFKPGPRETDPKETPHFRVMNRVYRKLKVMAQYKNQKPSTIREEFVIDYLINMSAKDFKIDVKDANTGAKRRVSLYDYFEQKYQVRLLLWQLPLVQMTKKSVVYPMEFLHLVPNQRYLIKLDEKQTADMIKFAVTRPAERMRSTIEGKDALDWGHDPVLQHFGMTISPNMIQTRARLLKNPKIQFGGSMTDPGTNGRWDLRNKKFLSTNTTELKSWGIGFFSDRIDSLVVDNFVQSFIKAYRNHGARNINPQPYQGKLPNDAGQAVEYLWQATGNKFQQRPQMLVFIVPNKDAFHYSRIKKSCDCRYGVVSQVMQYAHVQKNNLQYISNVLMKFNAKLGGTTSQAAPDQQQGSKPFGAPTMVIGADVSHPSPGSEAPSTAAITMSLDKFGGRYAAAIESNGKRVEMITEQNFKEMFAPLARHWAQNFGGRCPQNVYYFRDGVSEGQYQHVLNIEVPRIRSVLSTINGSKWEGKITVVICSKRHHIRVYPSRNDADRNGNPLPGTLIEKDVTSPHEWDFYLYSHIALQGTSRPVHYVVILDEMNHKANQIQNFVYEHCYQYMRSTTSVSLFPAVYYAHLASNRAKSHEDVASSDGPTGGPGYKMNTKQMVNEPPPTEYPRLIPFNEVGGIKFSMWYI